MVRFGKMIFIPLNQMSPRVTSSVSLKRTPSRLFPWKIWSKWNWHHSLFVYERATYFVPVCHNFLLILSHSISAITWIYSASEKFEWGRWVLQYGTCLCGRFTPQISLCIRKLWIQLEVSQSLCGLRTFWTVLWTKCRHKNRVAVHPRMADIIIVLE